MADSPWEDRSESSASHDGSPGPGSFPIDGDVAPSLSVKGSAGFGLRAPGFLGLGLGFDNGLIALSLLFWGLGSGLYVYIWPIYVAQLGAGPFEVGLILAVGGASSIAGFICGGFLAERVNWRLVLIVGWSIGTLAALTYALAETWWALVPGVFFLSFSGLCDPSLSSYIAAASRTRQLGRTFTLVFSAFSLGTALSPALGGWISGTAGMRPVFYLTLAMYVISTLVLLPIRSRGPTDQQEHAGRFLDGRGVSYLATLRVPEFRRLTAALLGLFTTGYLGVSLAPLFLNEQAGLSTGLVGGLGTLASVGGVISSLWLARTSDRMGLHRALALTQVLTMLSFLLFLGSAIGSSLNQIVLYLVVSAAYLLRGGMAAQTSLARASVLQVIQPPLAGRGFAIEMITLGIAQTAGPAVAGLLYSRDPRLPFVVAVAVGTLFTLFTAHRPFGQKASGGP